MVADRIRKFFRSIMDGVKHVGEHMAWLDLEGAESSYLIQSNGAPT